MKRKRHLNLRNISILVIVLTLIGLSITVFLPKILAKHTPKPQYESIVISEDKPNKVHIEYPKTDIESIDKFIESFALDSLNTFKENSFEMKDQAELNIRYEHKHVEDNIETFKFEKYEIYAHAANGSTTIQTFTFNTSTGNYISLANLFESQDDYQNFLDTLHTEIKTHVNNPDYTEPYLNDQGIDDVIKKVKNYDFDDKGISVHFDKYEIAPGYLGYQTITIPLDSLKGFKYEALKSGEPMGVKPEEEYKRIMDEREFNYYKDKKIIALSFDDGPHATNTPKFLDILGKEKVPGTFFMLGQNIVRYPEIVNRAYQEGHQVASHTYSHYDLIRLDKDKYSEEINVTDNALKDLGIDSGGFMRPPYGSYTKDILKQTNTIGILWDVDSQDWALKDSEKIVKEVMSNTRDGSIILMHDIYKESAEALETIIKSLKAEGYEFVTVKKLLELRGGYEKGQAYFNAR